MLLAMAVLTWMIVWMKFPGPSHPGTIGNTDGAGIDWRLWICDCRYPIPSRGKRRP
jgi:hypothetical protein